LNSLNEGPLNAEGRPDAAQACKKVFPVDPQAGGSRPIPDLPHAEDINSEEKHLGGKLSDDQQALNETSVEEGFKLRVALVAKVLMEKCRSSFLSRN
jgi:hypothetical protein